MRSGPSPVAVVGHAIKSVHAGLCPGCERGFNGHEGQTNFCVHCGMKLFEHCPSCGADKSAGTATLPDPATVAPVA